MPAGRTSDYDGSDLRTYLRARKQAYAPSSLVTDKNATSRDPPLIAATSGTNDRQPISPLSPARAEQSVLWR